MVSGPPGWDAERLPDGTTLLRRSGWGRFTSDVLQPVGLLLVGCSIVATLLQVLFGQPLRQAHQPASGLVWVVLMPLGILTLGLLLWAIWGKDELRVGPNQLEVRRRLFRWRKVKRLSDGLLVLRWERDLWSGDRSTVRWKLEARGLGGAATLDCRSDRAYNGILAELIIDSELPRPAPELVFLGEWLAQQTGWNLDQPPPRGKGRLS